MLQAKLPDVLSDAQKRNRVKNLLADLSRRNLIAPERKGPGARWRLVTQKNRITRCDSLFRVVPSASGLSGSGYSLFNSFLRTYYMG
ncbi:hypothetical protein MIZ03_4704 [Rhodoferax lithotrophicus]|uniref:Transcriptional regulator n=1 Tax=Rhodoferax lithotrophicus TaxID=2798804 RepID=A0ABN6DCK9_9BURK|nr:hypothetical protein MIZ03_4704 [Rhodoferax sp. MIZ03]